MRKVILLIAIAVTIVNTPCYGTIINIPSDYSTIQTGINASMNGDTVLVQQGTYVENINFNGKNIILTSNYIYSSISLDIDSTIIDGNSVGTVVTFDHGENNDAVISGFTITNGSADQGGGICCINSSPLILNSIICYNELTGNGGGIYCRSSSPVISYNTIKGNISTIDGAHSGGGIWCSENSSPLISNNLICNNSVNHLGGGIFSGESSPVLYSNTISNNQADWHGGGIAFRSSNLLGINTIVWGNSNEQIYLYNGSSISITFSDIQGGYSGEGNFNMDPLFADSSNGDYHLQEVSPCIDAGDPSFSVPPGGGDRIDMGAFEFIFYLELEYNPEDFIFDVTGDSTISGTLNLVSTDTSGYVKLFCDSSWVSFDADSVYLTNFDTVVVTATFDATGLDYNKTFTTEIYFESDAPGLEDAIINVEMTTHAPIPITIGMIPDEWPVEVEAGGYFSYEGILFNNIGGPIPYPEPISVWIKIEIRNILYGPIKEWHNINVNPQGNSYPGAVQYIHPEAVPGTYGYIAYCSPNYPEIMDSCYFEFTVIEGYGGFNREWEAFGWGDEGYYVGNTPTDYKLYQNYPNPFNTSTEIKYTLPQQSYVRLDIYNLNGQIVDGLLNRIQPPGEYSILWNASAYSSGIYFYRLTAGKKVFTKRMTLLK
ncbi:MAG: T9SS type A sorting domain-containing protein [bacterium]|nr:T9SS type A sorting domain-containing protein [bacterium]